MDTNDILSELKAERDKLTAAINALEPDGRHRTKGVSIPGRGRRKLSPASRKRISDAMKARWAARKKAGKKGRLSVISRAA